MYKVCGTLFRNWCWKSAKKTMIDSGADFFYQLHSSVWCQKLAARRYGIIHV